MTVNAYCPVLGLFSLWYICQTRKDLVPPSSKTHAISLDFPSPLSQHPQFSIRCYSCPGDYSVWFWSCSRLWDSCHKTELPLSIMVLSAFFTAALQPCCSLARSKLAFLGDMDKIRFREENAYICDMNGGTEAFFGVLCVSGVCMRHWWSDNEWYLNHKNLAHWHFERKEIDSHGLQSSFFFKNLSWQGR